MKRNNLLLRSLRQVWLATAILVGVTSLAAAELRVRGLNWFANRKAEQQLKLLLGDQRGPTLDANALEDAALVLISALNNEGFLEPILRVSPSRSMRRRPLRNAASMRRAFSGSLA